MKKITMAVAALVIAVPLSASVLAGGRGGCEFGPGPGATDGWGPMHGHGHWRAGEPMGMMMPMMQQLDLTEQQRRQLQEIAERGRTERQQWSSEQHDRRQALMLSDKFDEAAARQWLEQRDQHRQQRQLDNMRLHHEMVSVLTPEQKAKLQELMADWQPGPKSGMQPGKGGPGAGMGQGPGKGGN